MKPEERRSPRLVFTGSEEKFRRPDIMVMKVIQKKTS
jgi:hypothetical protein